MRIGGLLSVLSVVVLASPAPALAGAPQYRAVNETRFGKAWVAERKDATSVADAVRLTLADAAAFFGTRPKLGRAYEDSRTHRSGGATFTVDAKSGALKGWMTCEVGSGATKAAVAVIRADAPKGEWQRLIQPAGAPSAGAKAVEPAAAPAAAPVATPAADGPLPHPRPRRSIVTSSTTASPRSAWPTAGRRRHARPWTACCSSARKASRSGSR